MWLQVIENDVSGGKCRVTAEIDFDRRREPPKIIDSIARNDEGRLREVILCRNILHDVVIEPRIERADGGRVSGEGTHGESVDLIDRNVHSLMCESAPEKKGAVKAPFLVPSCLPVSRGRCPIDSRGGLHRCRQIPYPRHYLHRTEPLLLRHARPSKPDSPSLSS